MSSSSASRRSSSTPTTGRSIHTAIAATMSSLDDIKVALAKMMVQLQDLSIAIQTLSTTTAKNSQAIQCPQPPTNLGACWGKSVFTLTGLTTTFNERQDEALCSKPTLRR
ncbi:hypothetical protein GUJ93_ZPchr0004g38687 [Zizania palustris]|uniref:Uncharacterized protein n=1 Tax=Zizania palustris TaxID=103762 RepID=A0A8J5SB30_ZIZPA|nr:hypothetical protein GUJ93_ZPchr0004g38687 [Zizania palustris]